jgi:hypothetical protein
MTNLFMLRGSVTGVTQNFPSLNGAEIVIRKPKVEEADVPAGEAA